MSLWRQEQNEINPIPSQYPWYTNASHFNRTKLNCIQIDNRAEPTHPSYLLSRNPTEWGSSTTAAIYSNMTFRDNYISKRYEDYLLAEGGYFSRWLFNRVKMFRDEVFDPNTEVFVYQLMQDDQLLTH